MTNADGVQAAVIAKKPMHRKFLKSAIAELNKEEMDEFEVYVSFLLREGISIGMLADAYLTIVNDTFQEELRFKETGVYRCSSFAEAQVAVYNDEDYMHRYMIGLAISSYWWPNHAKMRRFFKQHLPQFAAKGGLYREIGPGHGVYFLESLRHGNFSAYEGVDISPISVAMTRRIIESGFFGTFPKAQIVQGDFLMDNEMEPSSTLVMGEVLEHVETPGAFLQRAYTTTTTDASVFLTTCVNAPAIDHLYNPGSVLNLEKLFYEHRFDICDRSIIPRHGTDLAQCERDKMAINVAYVLKKMT